jgi:hypothetical protein
MGEEGAVAVRQDQFGIALTRDPNKILAEAHRAARALKDVIESKPKEEKVIMGGKQYIEFEDWQTCGKFYNVTAQVEWTKPVEFGNVRGFHSRANVIDNRTGNVISSAEAMCLNDEEKWSTRPKYEWQDELDAQGKKIWIETPKDPKGRKGHYKGKRVKIGDEQVPMFQLMSMSQTRACAKGLRNVLSWVVVLAGYKPVVVEEMTGNEDEVQNHSADKTPIDDPKAKPETQTHPPEESQEAPEFINEQQGKRFYAKWKAAGKTKEEVKAYLTKLYGVGDDRKMPVKYYEQACAWAETQEAET